MDINEIVSKILKSDLKFALTISGGGSQAIGELLRHGGAAKNIVDINVTFGAGIEALLSKKPEILISEQTALELAVATYTRGATLKHEIYRLIGVTSLSKLSKNSQDKEKHVSLIAVHCADYTKIYSITYIKSRTREEEEWINSYFILAALAECCRIATAADLLKKFSLLEENEFHARELCMISSPIRDVFLGFSEKYLTYSKSLVKSNFNRPLIFSGNFNPIHKNHIQMINKAKSLKNRPIFIDISVSTENKSRLDYLSINDRTVRIISEKCEAIDGIYLTNSPTYGRKISIYSGSDFIIGSDTLIKINDMQYSGDEELKKIIASGVKFLVFNRKDVANIHNVRMDLMKICEFITVDDYLDDGTNSASIRKFANFLENS